MDLLRKPKPETKPALCLARYVVNKHSAWRGTYRRVLCITPEAIVTQDPGHGMSVTNIYTFTGDSDIDAITVGPGNNDEGEFSISCRQDKKVRA